MFKKLLAKLAGATPGPTPPREDKAGSSGPSHATLAELRQLVEQKREMDPLIGAKIGGRAVYERLSKVMMTADGIHVESLLCALGALAGYACQASLRRLAVEGGAREQAPFSITTAQDGRHYFSGEPLNQVLIAGKYSFWHLLAEVVRQAGGSRLPDIAEISAHVDETAGADNFGIPRLPAEHRPHDVPVRYLEAYWPVVLPIAQQLCHTPAEWPVLFTLAIQEVIEEGGEVLEADMAAKIVMESALPMARIDLDSL